MTFFQIGDVENSIEELSKLFDTARVIDPETKKVIYQKGDGENLIHGKDCYEFWQKEEFCDNCISSQAIIEEKTITKIEYKKDGAYMVIASPIEFGHNLYVLELLKDITETKILMEENAVGSKKSVGTIFELNEKVITDDLTGIYNRRYINQKLPEDIYYAIQNKEKLTIAMVDIDYFKEINDNYGHIMGDLVLKKLAHTIKSQIRSNYDWVARYGGDEFFIVLKNVDQDMAVKIANDIKRASENLIIGLENNNITINITVSLGLYTVEPESKDFNTIIYEADKNLKEAKESGRNKIVAS